MYVVVLFASSKGCCLCLFFVFLCFYLYLCCGCCVFLLCALVLPLAEGVTGWARRSPGCLDNYPGHITHNQDPAIYSLLIYYLYLILDNYSGHITHNLDPAIYSLLIYYLLFFSWIITRATPLTTKTLPFILDYFFIFYLFLDNYSGQITHNQDPALYSL